MSTSSSSVDLRSSSALWSSSAAASPFDSPGVLEHVLSYLVRPPRMSDLLSASLTSKRWREAARCDELWKDAAHRLWSTKVGIIRRTLPHEVGRMAEREEEEEGDGSSSLFHNAIFTEASYSWLTAVRDFFLSTLTLTKNFDDLWFGFYVCSLVDAKRTEMTIDELCDPAGYDLYRKANADLVFCGTCIFGKNGEIRIIKNPFEALPDRFRRLSRRDYLKRRWATVGKFGEGASRRTTWVQIELLPSFWLPFKASRTDDWGS